MFTINIYLKLALAAICLIGGMILAFVYGFWYAFPFLLIGILLLVSYVMLGTVQSAATMAQTMQFEEADKRLGLTLNPNWLYKTNRAFYYLMKGTIAMNQKDNDAAEKYLNIAQSIDLPTDNEKAMVGLQLANIHAMKGKWNNAKLHFNKVKKLKVTEPQLKEQVKQFEKALTNRGQMKHARTMQGRRGGGRSKRM
jgi:tetratricopeptide (TPR) repeat protein